MSNYVIAGAGPSGLYVAWRLLSSGTLKAGDSVQLYEWSQRPGGRIYTYQFPASVYPGGTRPDGLYCEVGGMRFAVDSKFPHQIVEGHVLVQQMIVAMNLQGSVVPFQASSNRLYYLRGENIYENDILDPAELPYNFNAQFTSFLAEQVSRPYTSDNVLGAIATAFAPGLGSSNADRAAWCRYYASGIVDSAWGTRVFPSGTAVRDMGYWNLLYDQLGDEGFDYAADAAGYTSNVINWNSADAMQANNDYGSSISYMRIDGGYGRLFDAMAAQVQELALDYPGSGIFYGQQLAGLAELGASQTECRLLDQMPSPARPYSVTADVLFLAMPRRSLELVAQGSAPGHMLNAPQVRYYLESSIDQPALKAVMVFDEAWWTSPSCKFPPQLVLPTNAPADTPVKQWVGGATITDLPLRMVYYFANNVPGGPGVSGGPYVLLASYDDMNYDQFWRELETSGDYETAPSLMRQPLAGPTEVPADSALANMLLKQLADTHGMALADIPAPTGVFFQDWGQDPFGAGYHGWAAHYDICQAMDNIRAPYQKVLGNPDRQTYIVGSCYSFDQAWVEGAFCTAESVLQDFIGLAPLNPAIAGYTLVCKT